ncbi:bifunctional hydroxymethylpyrimidine kinase/phosphomethylpyrimidine kinase [Denitromonas sp.]|uniref:bifunctional hydroxymethylpyrimidine kinase/phosphomethylpyrimidine kinase n=1 Tax=Denitromonas sp. TaxID=2734609 RepID=UPI003A844FF1
MRHVPAVLVIGPADPTSASGVAADVLSVARHGAYPLSVVSEMCLRDTTQFDGRVALDPELVLDQARMILEDVPVAALKLSVPGSVGLLVALAALVADYGEVPLVLEAPSLMLHEDDTDESPLAAAVELLLPQAAVLVADAGVSRRLVGSSFEGDEAQLRVEDLGAALCATGAAHVLVLGAPAGGQVVHLLHGRDGVLRRDAFARAPQPVLGLASSASAALAALIALGGDLAASVPAALRFAHEAEARALRLGMGAAVADRGVGA